MASVGIPPLLADIIREVLIARVNVDEMVEIAVSPQWIEALQALDPDVVVVASGDTTLAAAVGAALRRAKMVILSKDARRILVAGVERELTADTLADLLL